MKFPRASIPPPSPRPIPTIARWAVRWALLAGDIPNGKETCPCQSESFPGIHLAPHKWGSLMGVSGHASHRDQAPPDAATRETEAKYAGATQQEVGEAVKGERGAPGQAGMGAPRAESGGGRAQHPRVFLLH